MCHPRQSFAASGADTAWPPADLAIRGHECVHMRAAAPGRHQARALAGTLKLPIGNNPPGGSRSGEAHPFPANVGARYLFNETQVPSKRSLCMDFATLRDTMVAAVDLPGLVAYVVAISVALFGVGIATYADDLRDNRRQRVRIRSVPDGKKGSS